VSCGSGRLSSNAGRGRFVTGGQETRQQRGGQRAICERAAHGRALWRAAAPAPADGESASPSRGHAIMLQPSTGHPSVGRCTTRNQATNGRQDD
jgi:hypothetical protein